MPTLRQKKMKQSSLLKNLEFKAEKPAITVLFESDFTKESRIAFKSGQIMKKHQTGFPITVEMFEGTLDFGVNDEVHHLEKGDILALGPNVPHDLAATSDCIVRLSLAKGDSVTRVIGVTER